jgi:hypothetical protein
MWFVFLIHPNKMNLTRNGSAGVSASFRCVILVKMYGYSSMKVFISIIKDSEVRMNEFPLFLFPFLRIVFISLCSLFINRFTIMLFHDGISQIHVGISNSPIAVLVQFRGRLLISVVKSKRKSSLSLLLLLFLLSSSLSTTLLLLLLLLSLLSPLCRVFTIIYQKQIVFLGYVLLRLFCINKLCYM